MLDKIRKLLLVPMTITVVVAVGSDPSVPEATSNCKPDNVRCLECNNQ